MKSIGQLDRPVIIQKATKSQDAMGGSTFSYSNVATPFANVEWKNSSTDENENRVQGIQTVIFTIRNVSSVQKNINLQSNYRVAFPVSGGSVTSETQYYKVVGIRVIEGRQRFKELTTELDMRTFETS
jgi:head-tail adaptor